MKKSDIVYWLDRATEFLLYALIFFTPIAKAGVEIIFSMAMTTFFVKQLLAPNWKYFKKPVFLLLGLFFFFCALSMFNSGPYLAKSVRALFGKWLENVLIFVLAASTFNTPQRQRKAVAVLLSIAALVGIDAIFQMITGWDFFHGRVLVANFPTAGFENQNSLAAYLVTAGILSVVLAFSEEIKQRYRYPMLFLFLGLSLVLALASSRGGWLGFFMGIFLWLVISLDFKKVALPVIIFLIFLLAVPTSRVRLVNIFFRKNHAPEVVSNYSRRALPAVKSSDTTADGERGSLTQSALAMIRDNPVLGKGLGTYMDHYKEYATVPGVYYAHNSYLQIWAESGMFSLISFMMFIALLLGRGVMAFRRTRHALVLGLLCGIFGFLVHSFFDCHFYSLQLSASFWLMLGLFFAVANSDLEFPLNKS